MSNVLKADFFDLRKAKTTYILPGIAVLLGFLLPLMYYGIFVLLDVIADIDPSSEEASMDVLGSFLLGEHPAKTVFLTCLPFSQGIGIVIAAMVGFRAVRPFTTGIYRNKIIAQIPRRDIYLSQTVCCLLLTMVSALLYTLSVAFACFLTFGDPALTGRELAVVAILSCGIYLVYTAIPVFIAFVTRSTPLTIIISIALPILMQTVVPFAAIALNDAPEYISHLLALLPSYQSTYLTPTLLSDALQVSNTDLTLAASADAAIALLLTLFGILRFSKADMT